MTNYTDLLIGSIFGQIYNWWNSTWVNSDVNGIQWNEFVITIILQETNYRNLHVKKGFGDWYSALPVSRKSNRRILLVKLLTGQCQNCFQVHRYVRKIFTAFIKSKFEYKSWEWGTVSFVWKTNKMHPLDVKNRVVCLRISIPDGYIFRVQGILYLQDVRVRRICTCWVKEDSVSVGRTDQYNF